MNPPNLKTYQLMILGALGASLGALIYFWGTPSDCHTCSFFQTPEFISWFFVTEILFAAYPILIFMLWKTLKQLGKQLHRNFVEILVSTLITILLFLAPDIPGRKIINMGPLPFEYSNTKILLHEAVGFFAGGLPLIIGIWLIQAAIHDTFIKTPSAKHIVADYIYFRDSLQQFLVIFGALLSMFILSSATLRSVALVSNVVTVSQYPVVLLLFFGGYYTLMAAAIYFPTYLSLISEGHRLVNDHFPLPSPNSEGWVSKLSERKQLEDLLELNVSGAKRFLAAIPLLLPLLSSVLSVLVGK